VLKPKGVIFFTDDTCDLKLISGRWNADANTRIHFQRSAKYYKEPNIHKIFIIVSTVYQISVKTELMSFYYITIL